MSPKRFAFGDVVVIIAVLSASFLSWKFAGREKAKTVIITVNNKPYGKWPLPVQPETLSVNGAMNVELSPAGVRVLDSHCPRRICVNHNPITRTGQSIVCVPNRIVIRLGGGEKNTDAIAQ